MDEKETIPDNLTQELDDGSASAAPATKSIAIITSGGDAQGIYILYTCTVVVCINELITACKSLIFDIYYMLA